MQSSKLSIPASIWKKFHSTNVDKPIIYENNMCNLYDYYTPIRQSNIDLYQYYRPKESMEKKDNNRIKNLKYDMMRLLNVVFEKTPESKDLINYIVHPLAKIEYIPQEMLTNEMLLYIKPQDYKLIERYKFNYEAVMGLIKLHGIYVRYLIDMTKEVKEQVEASIYKN
jgi:hypothetical protein